MGSYYTYGVIPDPVRTVRGFDDGGLASIDGPGLAGAGGTEKPLMQELYERGEISDAEYRSWLQSQSSEPTGALEASPYTPPMETAGPSQEYNPVTPLPTTQGGLESSPYTPPVETSGPSQEYNPVTSLPTTIAAPAVSTGLTMKDIFGGNVPAGIDPNAPFAPSAQTAQQISDLDRLNRERQLEAGALSSFAGPTGGGTVITPGNFSMVQPQRSAAEVAADYAKASGLDLAGFAASQGKTEQQFMSEINAAENDLNTRRGVLNQIQTLAAAKDFQGAFQAAKAAEARLGGDFVSNLVSPTNIRYLTPEMSKDDINNYYDALKSVVGEQEYEKRYVSTGNEFSIEDARAKNLAAADQGQNFVNPDAGVKAQESIVGKIGGLAEPLAKAAAIVAAIYGGAQLLGGLGGAGGTAAGTAGAGTAGAGAAGAGAAGAGAAGAGALGAAGVASVLPEVVVAATKLGLTIPQYLALVSGTGALAAAAGSGGAGAGSAGVGATEPSVPSDLEEVVVKARPPVIPPVVVPPILPPTGGLTTPPTEPTPTDADLEEVEVKAKKPEPPVSPVITPPTSPPVEPPKGPLDTDLEEVEVKAKKPEPPVPPVITPPPELKDILKNYKPTEIKEPSTLDDLIKKYGTLENVLKILGLLGGVSGAGGAGGTGLGGKFDTSGGAGFGADLTPYDYGRRQLNPPIDYYTYATRPEAKFFEYGQQLDQPTQPTIPPPTEPSGVITRAVGGLIDENMTGGLIGYAVGGKSHKPERYVDGPGSGREDLIPAMLSDGEYVIDAETLALLGDGSTKEGARRMDSFRANIRKHKGRALSRGQISPNAKSPDKYMGGGLT